MAFQRASPRYGRGRGRGLVTRPGRDRISIRNDNKFLTESRPLGELLATLKFTDLGHAGHDALVDATIRDCSYVTSYNWLDVKSPTVVIPGKPPRWTPLKQAQRLKEDDGQYFRDPNAARFPAYPTEPAVQAVLQARPQLSASEVKFFVCGSTMGNLLRFVRQVDKPFRFNFELIGDTVFFVRKEKDPKEIIEDVRGYGHTFPEAYTTWDSDVKGSETHQRIIQYDLGGFKCMVRFECDGYLSDTTTKKASTSPKFSGELDTNELLTAFDNAKVRVSNAELNCALSIKSGGTSVAQETIFDLKTRSGRYKTEINMEDFYPLLWLKQIPNFIVAYHDGAGLFQDIRIQNVRKDVQAWEKQGDNRVAVKRLVKLLGKILQIAKQNQHELMEIYCPSPDHLEVRKQHGEGSHTLPPSLTKRWAGLESDFSDALSVDNGYDSGPDGGCNLQDEHDILDDQSDNGGEDYTACSADTCGYCGKCTY